MNNNDLISRAYVLAEYDRQHKGPPGGARKIMEEAPAVDAVPVEWLEYMQQECLSGNDKAIANAIKAILIEWQFIRA